MEKKPNAHASALGKIAAQRFKDLDKEARSEYMKAVRSGAKLKKTMPLPKVDKSI